VDGLLLCFVQGCGGTVEAGEELCFVFDGGDYGVVEWIAVVLVFTYFAAGWEGIGVVGWGI